MFKRNGLKTGLKDAKGNEIYVDDWVTWADDKDGSFVGLITKDGADGQVPDFWLAIGKRGEIDELKPHVKVLPLGDAHKNIRILFNHWEKYEIDKWGNPISIEEN